MKQGVIFDNIQRGVSGGFMATDFYIASRHNRRLSIISAICEAIVQTTFIALLCWLIDEAFARLIPTMEAGYRTSVVALFFTGIFSVCLPWRIADRVRAIDASNASVREAIRSFQEINPDTSLAVYSADQGIWLVEDMRSGFLERMPPDAFSRFRHHLAKTHETLAVGAFDMDGKVFQLDLETTGCKVSHGCWPAVMRVDGTNGKTDVRHIETHDIERSVNIPQTL